MKWFENFLIALYICDICRQQSGEGERNGSEDDDEEKPGKRMIGPRKKFAWDEKLRSVPHIMEHVGFTTWGIYFNQHLYHLSGIFTAVFFVCFLLDHCYVIWCGWSWDSMSWRARNLSLWKTTSKLLWKQKLNLCGLKAGCKPGECLYNAAWFILPVD